MQRSYSQKIQQAASHGKGGEKMEGDESQYRALFEHSSDGIALYERNTQTLERTLIECNAAYAAMAGRTQAELLAHPNIRSLQENHHSSAQSWNLNRKHAAGVPHRGVFSWVRPGGEDNWVEYQTVPLPVTDEQAQRGVVRMFGIDRDITQRVTLERELNAMKENLEDLVDTRTQLLASAQQLCGFGHWEFDSATGYTHFSQTAREILQLESAQWPPSISHLENRLSGAQRAHFGAAFQRALETCEAMQPTVYTLEVPGSQTPLHVEMTLTPTAEKDERRARRVVGTLQNVSESVQVQEELKGNLKRQEELNELKTQFVSMVSHELRTPLTTILWSADYVERAEATDALDAPKRTHYLKTIKQTVNRMNQMVGNFLILGKLDAARVQCQPHPTNLETLHKNCAQAQRQIHGEGIHLTVHTEAAGTQAAQTAPCDEKLLEHILNNLLSNALKYSKPETEVTSTLQLNPQTQVLTLTVKDNGCGIPKADQAHIFDAFTRGENVGSVKGTGVGMLVVKRCTQLHGGSVQFTSQEGEGTTFTVTIPLKDTTPTDNNN